jgi:hypothetical protein
MNTHACVTILVDMPACMSKDTPEMYMLADTPITHYPSQS